MRVLDLFAGIGGLSLGLERAGMQTVAFCEIDQFCTKVLNKHWPTAPVFGDIKNLTLKSLEEKGVVNSEAGLQIDLICGGFP